MTTPVTEESATTETAPRSRFQAGDLALLIDRKGRRYLLTLKETGSFHTHMGYLDHGSIIGRQEGEWFYTNSGHRFLGLKPTLSDYILEMDRVTQVIYPKDIGAILMMGDIFPGAKVVEGGFGSGALTMAMLRSLGDNGSITSYEVRKAQGEKALRNIGPLLTEGPTLTVKEADIYQGIEETEIDRLVLDVPEPWRVVSSAASALVQGGIFLSFLPTVLQVHRLTAALNEQGCFQLIETVELMLRSWHVTDNSMRPDHRMVAHTGFITTARKCLPRPTGRVSQASEERGKEDGQREHRPIP
jgi:tRNA (adenine57-N1/adenine58-N1)-methyltransferase